MPDDPCEPGRPEPPLPLPGRVSEEASEYLLAVEARDRAPGALADPDGDAGAALAVAGASLAAGRKVGRTGATLTAGGSGGLAGSFGAALTVGASSTLT
jgi:hypothetical protein